MDIHAEYGCGKSDVMQIPWLFMYVVNCGASAVELGLLTVGSVPSDQKSAASIEPPLPFHVPDAELTAAVSALVGFALSHGILMLGSVIHHVPTVSPHGELLWFMRATLCVYTANAWIQCFQGIREVIARDYDYNATSAAGW